MPIFVWIIIGAVLVCLGYFLPGMPIFVWIIIGAVLLFLELFLPVYIKQRRSVIYTNQTFAELEDHFDHFVMRAFPNAEFYIQDDMGKEFIRIRKDCPLGRRGFDAYVIFQETTKDDPQTKTLQRSLVHSGFKGRCGFGVKIWDSSNRYKDLLVCTCNTLEEVIVAVKKAFQKFYDIPDDATFTVYARGGIKDGYIIRDHQTTFRESVANIRTGEWARPYLKHQVKPHEENHCDAKGKRRFDKSSRPAGSPMALDYLSELERQHHDGHTGAKDSGINKSLVAFPRQEAEDDATDHRQHES